MAKVEKGMNSLEKKLHRIVRQANPKYNNNIELARAINGRKFKEFSYIRFKDVCYSSSSSISFYISFAKEIGLINEDFTFNISREDLNSLSFNFNEYLGDIVLEYLKANDCDLNKISNAIQKLYINQPYRLSSPENIYTVLNLSLSQKYFKLCLTCLTIIRPGGIQFANRRVVLIPGIITT